MSQFQIGFALCLALLGSPVQAAGNHLSLIHYGWIENEDDSLVREFRLGFGDTTAQDEIANTPFRAGMGPFGMNAAIYLRNADGTWNLFNYRLPDDSLLRPVASDGHREFVTLLKRNDVGELLKRPYDPVDFGAPEDYIYKKMNLPASALPEPFNRFPDDVLENLSMVMQYNADKTAKAYFKQPADQEEAAIALFQKIVDVIER